MLSVNRRQWHVLMHTKRNTGLSTSRRIKKLSKMTPILAGQWKCARKLKTWQCRTGIWRSLWLLTNAMCQNHPFWPSSTGAWGCQRSVLAWFQESWLH